MTTPSIFNYWQEWYNVENISANFSDAGWTPLDNNPFILQTRYNIPAENPRDIYICLPDGNLQYIWTIGRSNRTMGLCSDDSPPYIAVFLYTRGDASVHFYPHTPCSVKTLLPCQGTNQDGQRCEPIFPHPNYLSITSDWQLLWNAFGLKAVSLERDTRWIRIRGEYRYLWAKQR